MGVECLCDEDRRRWQVYITDEAGPEDKNAFRSIPEAIERCRAVLAGAGH